MWSFDSVVTHRQDDAKKNKIAAVIRTASYLQATARDVMQLSSLVRPPAGAPKPTSSLS
jgi:hypothetical protein